MVDCLVSLSDAVIGHARAVTCLRETPTSVSVTLSCSLVPLTCVTPPLVTDTENQFTLHVTRGGGVVGWWWGGTDQHPMAARGGRHTQRPRVPP